MTIAEIKRGMRMICVKYGKLDTCKGCPYENENEECTLKEIEDMTLEELTEAVKLINEHVGK